MFKQPRQLLFLLLIGLMSSGCGDSKPAAPVAPAVVPSAGTPPASPVTLTPTSAATSKSAAEMPEDPPVAKAKPLNDAPPKAAVAVTAQTFPEAALLGNDVVGLLVAHPKRITAWPVYQMMKEAGLLGDFERQMQDFHVQPEAVERLTLIIDQSSINTSAKSIGLEVSGDDAEPAPALGDNLLKNNLKQTALGFHNYHDSYTRLPRADGNGEGNQTGLSWRVHLLPYFEEAELYQQFHLDEPWDSDHNKTLIEKMPAYFRTPGVTEAGKTSMHVFTGKGTPFEGEQGKRMADFLDGTSNTILAVLAGPDTAEVWTKPGGLEFDPATCKKALGTLSGKTFLATLTDGSVRSLSSDIDETLLANLIQIADGNVVDLESVQPTRSAPQIPTAILTLADVADQPALAKSILLEATEETVEGQTLFKNETSAVWFANEKTVVGGSIETVKQMITAKKSGKPGTPTVLSQLQLGADLTFALDVVSQKSLMEQAVQLNPSLGLALQVKSLTLQLSVTGVAGDKLLELVVTTNDEQSAAFLSQLAAGGLAQGKAGFGQFPLPEDTAEEQATKKLVEQIVMSADVKQNGDRIEFVIPVPKGFDKLPELLKPSMEKAVQAQNAARELNHLKQIGLAFHNYHDTFMKFPGADRSAAGKVGLSWRVHLLPFLDQAPLYNQFNFNEAWDSDHNKALIEKMPDIFKVDGVTEAGKTSLHVFTGDGAPFADDATPDISNFTDGTSNTILVVRAGTDTADIWTKPGGLDFDPKEPIKSLGTIVDELNRFVALFTDGSVRRISTTVPAETMLHLIQHQDGQPVDGF